MDMQEMMKQAQNIQRQLMEATSKNVGKEFTGNAAGDKVIATIQNVAIGSHRLMSIKIDESLIEKEEKEILEDLIITSINAALKNAEAQSTESLSTAGEMLGLPTDMKLPF